VSPVIDFDPARRTNAQAIADLATLGVLHQDSWMLDATVGPERGFWKQWWPRHLVTNDSDETVTADHHWDARHMPVMDGAFDVVVFDPPYANRGTSRHPMDPRYGLDAGYRTKVDVEALLVEGTVEALRVTTKLALIKCQDACVSGHYAPQTFLVWEAAKAAGARLMGEMYVVGRREQPTGKRQKNVWSACSTLMIFERGRKR
jgi:hypothetical protein